MGTYVTPADVPISSSWQDHRNRNPPSAEPGTDYATAYGTSIRCAESGTISVIDTNPSGGEGRRLSIDLDDGQRVSYIHLSSINAFVGQRVARGQSGFMFSGASGNGSDWYYGPHVPVSLWSHPGMSYADTIDFAAYVGNQPEDDEMNAEQNNALMSVYQAVFSGGGDAGDQSIIQRMVDLQTRTANLEHQVLGSDGTFADTNHTYRLMQLQKGQDSVLQQRDSGIRLLSVGVGLLVLLSAGDLAALIAMLVGR